MFYRSDAYNLPSLGQIVFAMFECSTIIIMFVMFISFIMIIIMFVMFMI